MKTLVFLAVMALGVAFTQAADKPALKQARTKFEAADAELNKVYKAVMAELDKAKAAQLREDERAWVTYRDEMSEGMPAFNTGEPTDTPKLTVDYWEAMASFTGNRAEFLRVYSGKNVPPGITGEYSDSYGGTLDLEETDKGLAFSFSVVRGHAHNIGELSGIMQRKGDKALFKQKLDPGDEGPACELVFTFIGGHIVKAEEKVRDPEAGNGVHYDGDYYKIGKLKHPVKPD